MDGSLPMRLYQWCINGLSVKHGTIHGIIHTQALSEAGQKLKAGDQTASSLRSEVERLSSALKELDSQRQTWTGGSEDFQREVSQLRGEVDDGGMTGRTVGRFETTRYDNSFFHGLDFK